MEPLSTFKIRFFSSQSCSEFNSQNCSDAMAKRQEGDFDERVVAKSKPDRNLASRGCAGPSTTVSSTVSSSRGHSDWKITKLGLKLIRTEKPSYNNQPENLSERDRGRHEETSSRATTGSPMTQKPSQTEDPTACTGRLVPPFESWGDLFCPFNLIQRESGWGCEWLWIVLQAIRWNELTRVTLFGKYSRLHLCTQQSVLEKSTSRIYISCEIQVRNQLYRNCSMRLKHWSANKNWRSRECQN